ncbi:MAG: EamA family transporter [Chloroflexota bacterium]
MNPLGPLLALLSAASWGTGDFFGGLASKVGTLRPALVLIQLFGFVVALVAMLVARDPLPTSAGMAWAVAGGAAGVLGLGCLYLALATGTMGLVAPLVGLISAAIPAVVGVLRGDPVGPLLLVGMGVALVAIVVISLPDRGAAPVAAGPPAAGPHGARLSARDWGLVLGAGLGVAAFYLCTDAAHDAGASTAWALVGVRVASVVVALGLLLVPRLAGRPAPFPRSRRLVGLAALAALGDTGGNAFYIAAAGVGTLSVAVVLSSLYPVATVLWARFLLHERLGRVRLAGVALAVLGAVLITAGAAIA